MEKTEEEVVVSLIRKAPQTQPSNGLDEEEERKKQVEWNGSTSQEAKNSVYLDKDNGAESSNGTDGMSSSIVKQKLETLNDAEIQNNLTNGNAHENLKVEHSSGLHLLLSEETSENGNTGTKHVQRRVEESKQQVVEWDVERVLDEQDTHDLYCPKCNSCITNRVILKKRKRDGKREKIEQVEESSSTAINTTNNQDNPPTELDFPGSGPDLFRCSSCFSFFISTVSGFKLFRSFRDRGAGENVQSDEQIGAMNRLQPGEDVVQHVEVDVVRGKQTSEYLFSQKNDSISSVISVPKKSLIQPVNDTRMKPSEDIKDFTVSPTPASIFVENMENAFEKKPDARTRKQNEGNDVMVCETEVDEQNIPQTVQNNIVPSTPVVLSDIENQRVNEAGSTPQWDILKSIVYGGLIESITSLSVVTSAAGGGATTLNIVALGLANLVGGFLILAHGLRDLKTEKYGGATDQNEEVDRYQEVLGQRRNFCVHATVAVISYLVFGLVPPITYGLAFHKSDNKENKLIVVAAASLFCIIVLAIGKAYTRKPPKAYIKTLLYFLIIGVMASGLSCAVGVMINKFLQKLGWFDASIVNAVSLFSPFIETLSTKPSWASY